MKAQVKTTETRAKIRESGGISIQVTNINTEKVTKYVSKKEASIALKVSDSTIKCYIRSEKTIAG